jgi:hypothetical protein
MTFFLVPLKSCAPNSAFGPTKTSLCPQGTKIQLAVLAEGVIENFALQNRKNGSLCPNLYEPRRFDSRPIPRQVHRSLVSAS